MIQYNHIADSILIDEDAFRPADMDPIFALWASVMRQGLCEAMAEFRSRVRKAPVEFGQVRYGAARRWFESDAVYPGSLVWLCDVFGYDPARVRGKCRANARSLAEKGEAIALVVKPAPTAKKPATLHPAKTCPGCGTTFRPNRTNQEHCTHTCTKRAARAQQKRGRKPGTPNATLAEKLAAHLESKNKCS